MTVDARRFQGSAGCQQQAAEAARHLTNRTQVNIVGNDGSPSESDTVTALQLYQYTWSTAHDRLVAQAIKDHAREFIASGQTTGLVLRKRAVDLVHGSLFTPEQKLCIIIPLPPATGRVLFHTKTEGTEVEWNAPSYYRLGGGMAIRPLQANLTFVLLLFDKPDPNPDAETAKIGSLPAAESSSPEQKNVTS